MQSLILTSLLALCQGLALASSLQAAPSNAAPALPEEIVAVGGQGAALVQSGVASVSDQAAIHLNPAMLYLHRAYDVGGGYFWPSAGRPFYKLSVIDGVTSRMVAAFEYTGFQDNLRDRNQADAIGDSSVMKRGSVALAIPTDFFVIGFAGHYVEAQGPVDETLEPTNYKGISLGVGLVALLSNQLRLGLSLENFNNKRVASVAPRTARAGLSWEDRTATVTLHGELRQRDRSATFELTDPVLDGLTLAAAPRDDRPEQMALTGLQVKTFDMLKVFAGYGRTLRGETQDVMGGGVGIFQRQFSFSYAASKISPAAKDWQSSLHLSLTMKI